MSIILSIYAAILSTLLAIPKVIELWKNLFSPIKFICRSFNGIDAKKEDTPDFLVVDLFDITVVNKSKETQYFSSYNLEFKLGSKKTLYTNSSGLINVNFPHKLESGANFREYNMITHRLSHFEEINKTNLRMFSKFRITVENSLGNKYKSRWYNHTMTINNQKIKWEKLENIDEYNALLNNALK